MAKWLKTYEKVVKLGGISIPPQVLFIGGAVAFGAFLVLALIFRDLLFFLLGLVAADIIVFFPYYRGMKKIDDIEENLADVLREIATILRSGGTYEVAIREVVTSDYGEISRQFRYVLEDLESGLTFQTALLRLSERVPSDILRRVVVILVDAVKAGGGLANVLDDAADDARETARIKKERRAKTTMQVMFLFAASGVLSPFIVGAVQGIMDFFLKVGLDFVKVGVVTKEAYAASERALGMISFFLTVYVLIQASLSSIMIAFIRGERAAAGLRTLPFLALVAYIIMTGARGLVRVIVGI